MEQAVGDIRSFWFGTLDPDGLAPAEKQRSWWHSSNTFDREIETRFGEYLHRAEQGELSSWLDTPHACLAYIILLDQFSRNIYRHSERVFANDMAARSATGHMIANNYLAQLATAEKAFVLMPLMHSEQLQDHNLFEQVVRQQQSIAGLSESIIQFWSGMLQAAEEHSVIIKRFGRYPHRNEVLKRQSTDAELEYLAQASRRFGQ